MKTIEEKAKAYDEFLKRAKELYNKDHHKSEDLEYIFRDDLKEENDEKNLIETLINFFTFYKIEKVGEFTSDQIVGWLKKQLERPKYEWSGKITSRKAKGKLGALLKDLESRKKIDNRPIFRIGDTLKKKGKDYTFTVDRIQGGYYHCDRNNGAFFPIEEQYDWELIDDGKISPKFKIGDWITDGLHTAKISSIDDNYYWAYEYTVPGDIKSTDDQCHLWSIEDAKDGDILASHECYVIFKEIDGPNIRCYCTYHYMNDPSFSINTLHNKSAFHPATKEECELLYQKAKEAGYEWDKEHKNSETVEKFVVGKWYLCIKDFFGKGVHFDKGTAYYCAKEGCLQCEYGCHIAIVKDLYDNFKLWTIQDAKDGDVLVSTWKGNQYIYIFKNIEQGVIISYIYYCPKLDAVDMGAINMDNIPTVPATKEQQELLFSKIKEEGYKWDDTEKLGVDTNQNSSSITEQNLTWSEEDEAMCQETIDWFEQKCFPYASEEENPAKRSIGWLKSLKQRMGK